MVRQRNLKEIARFIARSSDGAVFEIVAYQSQAPGRRRRGGGWVAAPIEYWTSQDEHVTRIRPGVFEIRVGGMKDVQVRTNDPSAP